jgi:glycine C-acetyltransferase
MTIQEIEKATPNLLINIRTMDSPADAWMVVDGKRVLNFCTNNYLGLANHPRLKEAAKAAVDAWGVGPAAVRSIAGTQSLHLELERRLAGFKRAEGASTCRAASAPTRRRSRRWWVRRTSSSRTG